MPIAIPVLNDPGQETILRDAVLVTNDRLRKLNAAHVDITPEAFLQDVIARYIAGCQPALVQELSFRNPLDPIRPRLLGTYNP